MDWKGLQRRQIVAGEESSLCPVCLENFSLGDEVTNVLSERRTSLCFVHIPDLRAHYSNTNPQVLILTCAHLTHTNCLVPWLKRSSVVNSVASEY